MGRTIVDTTGKMVKATVDDKPVYAYRDIILRDGEQIHLTIS